MALENAALSLYLRKMQRLMRQTPTRRSEPSQVIYPSAKKMIKALFLLLWKSDEVSKTTQYINAKDRRARVLFASFPSLPFPQATMISSSLGVDTKLHATSELDTKTCWSSFLSALHQLHCIFVISQSSADTATEALHVFIRYPAHIASTTTR